MQDMDADQAAAKFEAKLIAAVTGRKIYLRGVEKEDLPKRVEWINDPVVQRTLNFQYPLSLAKVEKWLSAVAGDTTRRDFSICTRDDHRYIGFGGFLSIDPLVRKAEMYVTIGDRKYWGAGYGHDAYEVCCRFGFLELGLNRIYGYLLPFNKKSVRLVERLGWKVEGLLRQDSYSHGEFRDRLVMAVLREDWLRLQSDGDSSQAVPPGAATTTGMPAT